MALLYGRARALNSTNGGFRPGQDPRAFRESIETRCLVILPEGVDVVPSFTVGGAAKL